MTYKLAVISILGFCITSALISGSSFKKPFDKTVVISGKYIGVKQPMTILIRDYSHELDANYPIYIDSINTTRDGHFKVTLTLNNPQEIALESEFSFDKIFVEPGDSLYFESDGESQNQFQNITGLGSDKLKASTIIGNHLSILEMVNVDSAEIILEFENRLVSRNKIIDSLRNYFSEAYINYVIAQKIYEVDYFYRAFPRYLKMSKKLEFPTDTVAIIKADENVINYAKKGFNNTNFSQLLFSVSLSRGFRTDVRNIKDQFYDYKKIVKGMNLTSSDEQLMLGKFFLRSFKKGNISEVESSLLEFFNNYPHSTYTKTLKKEFQEWRALSSGMPAPDFTASKINGEVFKLSNLKGKVVYVDIWATWCGPCREEFTYSKKIQPQFKDNKNIVFLYVSIDDEKKKWLDYLKKDTGLYGLHVHDPGNFESNISKAYKVNGIPKYMIIDRNGNIFATEAYRPSSGEQLVKQLNDALSQ